MSDVYGRVPTALPCGRSIGHFPQWSERLRPAPGRAGLKTSTKGATSRARRDAHRAKCGHRGRLTGRCPPGGILRCLHAPAAGGTDAPVSHRGRELIGVRAKRSLARLPGRGGPDRRRPPQAWVELPDGRTGGGRCGTTATPSDSARRCAPRLGDLGAGRVARGSSLPPLALC